MLGGLVGWWAVRTPAVIPANGAAARRLYQLSPRTSGAGSWRYHEQPSHGSVLPACDATNRATASHALGAHSRRSCSRICGVCAHSMAEDGLLRRRLVGGVCIQRVG